MEELSSLQAQVEYQRQEYARYCRLVQEQRRLLGDLQRLEEARFLLVTELGDLIVQIRRFSQVVKGLE